MRPNNPQVATAMCDRLNAFELRRRLLPRSGGQGVAGSNPAVPTQVRGLTPNLGSALGTMSIFLWRFWRILTAGR
jgi:hypothetical protein